MGGKQMGGDDRQRRKEAKAARDAEQKPSEVGATQGANKQRTKADEKSTHQEKIDLKREGKQDQVGEATSEARPGSRDADTPDRQKYPRRGEES